jgi:hypothetical protein
MDARVTMSDVTCAIGLDSLYGTRVVTFISDRACIATVPGGRYVIEVTVPPFGLLPGKYLMSVSLFSGGQYHDYLIHFGAVRVLPLDLDGGQHVEEHVDRGSIAVPSAWRVSELACPVPA